LSICTRSGKHPDEERRGRSGEPATRAFGSPNYCNYIELCGWGRYLARLYTFGASVPGVYVPDLENAGCILNIRPATGEEHHGQDRD
jgi:anaerobic selenocysteine-containing dehydrogenase